MKPVALIFVLLAWVGDRPRASAPPTGSAVCTCVSEVLGLPEVEQVRAALDEADAVFLGRVMGARFIPDEERLLGIPFDMIEYEIAVDRAWKGSVDSVAFVRTGSDGGLCGVELPLGKWAVIYARIPVEGEPGRLYTSVCERTRPVHQGGSDEEVGRLDEVTRRD